MVLGWSLPGCRFPIRVEVRQLRIMCVPTWAKGTAQVLRYPACPQYLPGTFCSNSRQASSGSPTGMLWPRKGWLRSHQRAGLLSPSSAHTCARSSRTLASGQGSQGRGGTVCAVPLDVSHQGSVFPTCLQTCVTGEPFTAA